MASSSSIYGANPVQPKQEDLAPAPMSPYAVSKLAGEGFGRSFWHVYGLECVALRYFNVFGPHQDPQSEYAAVIPKFMAACLDEQAPTIFGDGEQSRDFTFVDNVVDANLLARDASAEVAGQRLQRRRGERVSLNQLLNRVREITGSDVMADHRAERAGDVRHSLADISRARAELGYEPNVDLHEGLRRTLATFERVPTPTVSGSP